MAGGLGRAWARGQLGQWHSQDWCQLQRWDAAGNAVGLWRCPEKGQGVCLDPDEPMCGEMGSSQPHSPGTDLLPLLPTRLAVPSSSPGSWGQKKAGTALCPLVAHVHARNGAALGLGQTLQGLCPLHPGIVSGARSWVCTRAGIWVLFPTTPPFLPSLYPLHSPFPLHPLLLQ